MYEWFAHKLIGTPLQRPAELLRWWAGFPRRRRHPELSEIHAEPERLRLAIRKAVRDGDNCVDVGAHLGSVTALFVRYSPTGRHIAIEPLAYKARWLERKFPSVKIHESAVGAREGEVDFFWSPSESGYSGLKSNSRTESAGSALRVKCRKLDDLVPEDVRVRMLKVDVEGGELDVFRGATRLLTKDRPSIVFECTCTGLTSFGLQPEDMYAELTGRFGYDIYLLKNWLEEGRSLDLAEFKKAMVYPFQAFNFMAAPRR